MEIAKKKFTFVIFRMIKTQKNGGFNSQCMQRTGSGVKIILKRTFAYCVHTHRLRETQARHKSLGCSTGVTFNAETHIKISQVS